MTATIESLLARADASTAPLRHSLEHADQRMVRSTAGVTRSLYRSNRRFAQLGTSTTKKEHDIMAALTRDLILLANDFNPILVRVPEWGGEVYVRCMAAGDRDLWEGELIQRSAKRQESIKESVKNLRAVFLAKCICDADGKLLFGPDDIEALSAKSYQAIDRVYEVAQTVNGLTDADVAELEEATPSKKRGKKK